MTIDAVEGKLVLMGTTLKRTVNKEDEYQLAKGYTYNRNARQDTR